MPIIQTSNSGALTAINPATGSTTLSFAAPTTAGNAIIVFVGGWHASGYDGAADDDVGGGTNTYTKVSAGTANNSRLIIASAINAASRSAVTMYHDQGSACEGWCIAFEVSNVPAIGGVNITGVDFGDPTATDAVVTATTDYAETLDIAACAIRSADSALGLSGPSGFTQIDSIKQDGTVMGFAIGQQLSSSAGLKTAQFAHDNTGAGAWLAAMISLKQVSAAADPAVRSTSNPAESATGNVTLNEPTGAAENDILLATIAYRDNAAFTPPADWAPVVQDNSGNLSTIASGGMWWIRRGASAPSYTFTRTGGDVARGVVVAIQGATTNGSPIDGAPTINTLASASTTVTTGGITTARAGSLLLLGLAGSDDTSASGYTAATSPTSGWAELHDSNTGTGNDTTIAVAAATKSTAGATGTFSITAGSSGRHVAMAVAILGPSVLDAAAAGVASASAALTTQIKLAAAATSNASSTATITTAIRLAMAAISTAAASGSLGTQIRLGAAASDVATATAEFASGAVLQAAAADVAVATAALTAAITLTAAASSQATATAVLTNWATVTLSGTLYTGQGGALDPNFWVDDVPTVGTTLYYDATHVTIYPNAEISSDTNNCAAIVQFLGPNGWAVGLIVITSGLAAVARDSASAAGQLTSAIQLAAAASALSAATAAFSTGAGMVAAASGVASATGSLATQVPLSALAADVATVTGALTAQINLAAAAAGLASANADLNGIIVLNAAAAAITSATGALGTSIRVGGAASDTASAVGALTTGIRASAAAQDVASAAAALSTTIAMGGQASNLVSSTGDLTTARLLVAAALNVSMAVAMLSTGISLDANAEAISQSSAELSGYIRLLAEAEAQSSSTAVLSDVVETPEIGIYASDPRFAVSQSRSRTPRFGRKWTSEKVVLTFDLGALLQGDETLNGPITLSIEAIAGTDASASDLFYAYPAYDMTKRQVLMPVRGGLSGCTYFVTVSAATTNSFKTVTLAGLLPVR